MVACQERVFASRFRVLSSRAANERIGLEGVRAKNLARKTWREKLGAENLARKTGGGNYEKPGFIRRVYGDRSRHLLWRRKCAASQYPAGQYPRTSHRGSTRSLQH